MNRWNILSIYLIIIYLFRKVYSHRVPCSHLVPLTVSFRGRVIYNTFSMYYSLISCQFLRFLTSNNMNLTPSPQLSSQATDSGTRLFNLDVVLSFRLKSRGSSFGLWQVDLTQTVDHDFVAGLLQPHCRVHAVVFIPGEGKDRGMTPWPRDGWPVLPSSTARRLVEFDRGRLPIVDEHLVHRDHWHDPSVQV